MKAIVMEIRGDNAVVLDGDGRFHRVVNRGYHVGDRIDMSTAMVLPASAGSRSSGSGGMKKMLPRIIACAACLILLIGTVGALVLGSAEYGYVSIDVNPSIEIRTNRFDKVVEVDALNDDGEALIASIGAKRLKGEDIADAMDMIVEAIADQGYFDGEAPRMVISSSSKSEKKAESLNRIILACADRNEQLKNVALNIATVSLETMEEAHKLGVSPGKLRLIRTLGEDIDVEAWLEKPMNEICDAVAEQGSFGSSGAETTISETTVAEPSLGIDTEPITEEPVATDAVMTTEQPETESVPETETVTVKSPPDTASAPAPETTAEPESLPPAETDVTTFAEETTDEPDEITQLEPETTISEPETTVPAETGPNGSDKPGWRPPWWWDWFFGRM